MKTIIGITTLFFALNTFSQENPWEKKTNENPWETSEVTKNDSVFPVETQNTITDLSNSIEYSEKGYNETKATGGLVSGAILCSLFNVFGAIPPIFAIAIPTPKELTAKRRLIKENNNVTDLQIKEYKRGMVKKRFRQTLKGSGVGILINTTVIITVIKIYSY